MIDPLTPEALTMPTLLAELSAREKSVSDIDAIAAEVRRDMLQRISEGRPYDFIIEPNREDLGASLVARQKEVLDERVATDPEEPQERLITIDSPFVAVQAGKLLLREESFKLKFFSILTEDKDETGRVVAFWQFTLDERNIDGVQVVQQSPQGHPIDIWTGDADAIVLPNTDQIRR